MQILDLAKALLRYDALAARQWVADFQRSPTPWSDLGRPEDGTDEENAVAAGVIELMAERAGQDAPTWIHDIPPSPRPIFLVRAAETMPRLRHTCEFEGPLSLRRRRLFAPPDFLTAA